MKMTLEIDTNMTDSEILAPVRKARKEIGEKFATLQQERSSVPPPRLPDKIVTPKAPTKPKEYKPKGK
jgi:hypothetical protein